MVDSVPQAVEDAVEVTMDRQGRLVIPRAERERLGVADGGTFELLTTPEGVILERRRDATIDTAADGLPLVHLTDAGTISNDDAVAALHAARDGR
jgi:AbrB family looped-hinge helix DNA binding protein